MNSPRRIFAAGGIEFFRRFAFAQDRPSPPEPFGYNMGWIAAKNAKPEDLAHVLKLQSPRPASWARGVKAAYEEEKNAPTFVAPPIHGWVLAVSSGFTEGDPMAALLVDLSKRFGEVQGFATHHVVEYHHWILARDGQLDRVFAYIGERGEKLRNSGTPTDVERKLKFFSKPSSQWMPGEEDVMAVARGWSLDPTSLGVDSAKPELGLLGRRL